MSTVHPNGVDLTAIWKSISTQLDPKAVITEKEFYTWYLGKLNPFKDAKDHTTTSTATMLPKTSPTVKELTLSGKVIGWNFISCYCPCSVCKHILCLECEILNCEECQEQCS